MFSVFLLDFLCLCFLLLYYFINFYVLFNVNSTWKSKFCWPSVDEVVTFIEIFILTTNQDFKLVCIKVIYYSPDILSSKMTCLILRFYLLMGIPIIFIPFDISCFMRCLFFWFLPSLFYLCIFAFIVCVKQFLRLDLGENSEKVSETRLFSLAFSNSSVKMLYWWYITNELFQVYLG